jgi:tRNA(His) guanylyltransferase
LAEQKNEILFKEFGINYNNEKEMYRKGTIVYRGYVPETVTDSRTGEQTTRKRKQVIVAHRDIIGDEFWKENPHILK